MITGVVEAREGRIRFVVRGPDGREQSVEAVIDTGFTTSLTLPPALVADLGLRWRTSDRGILADGSECLFDVFDAVIAWDGEARTILVSEMDATPLVGMTLLDGHELRMQIRSGGRVTIRPLSRRKHG